MLVSALAGQMLTHGSDLRMLMRQAAVNPDIWQRGAEKSQATAEVFRRAVLEHPEDCRTSSDSIGRAELDPMAWVARCRVDLPG